jgi:hypothetical protein
MAFASATVAGGESLGRACAIRCQQSPSRADAESTGQGRPIAAWFALTSIVA